MSIIDKHKDSERIKGFICSNYAQGSSSRLITQGLSDLYGLKLSHNTVAKWIKENKADIQYYDFGKIKSTEDVVSFDRELYEQLTSSAEFTEVQKLKYKMLILASCNAEQHIQTGKRLNLDYTRILKTLSDIELNYSKLQQNEVQKDVTSNEHNLSKLNSDYDLGKLSLEELRQLELLTSKMRPTIIIERPKEFDNFKPITNENDITD